MSSYTVSANIQHTSGINTALVYYTTDLAAGFSPPITMNNISNNTWEADIPGTVSSGQKVYYYIEAIANNGKMMKRPMPAPLGYFDFNILDNTTHLENRVGVTIDAYPNPASAITCIPVNLSRNTFGTFLLLMFLENVLPNYTVEKSVLEKLFITCFYSVVVQHP